MKIYLAHPISTTGESRDSIRVANEIRKLGFNVYAAAENAKINDKSNNPTPRQIYREDVRKELKHADLVVVNLTGGNQDGTVFELGVVSGINEERKDSGKEPIKIIGYTSNARALQPQHHKGVASASLNHLNLGGEEEWGEFVGSEQNMIKKLEDMR